MTCRNCWLES